MPKSMKPKNKIAQKSHTPKPDDVPPVANSLEGSRYLASEEEQRKFAAEHGSELVISIGIVKPRGAPLKSAEAQDAKEEAT